MKKKYLELGADGRNAMLYHAKKLYESNVISKLAYRKIEHKLEKIPVGISRRKLREKIKEIKKETKGTDYEVLAECIIDKFRELLGDDK